MSDWEGSARTNYFRVVDMEGLQKALEPFDIDIKIHPEESEYVMLHPGSNSQDGGFEWSIVDDEGMDLEFEFEADVMPFVAEGEIVVMQECGAQKLCYLTGSAQAYIRDGENVDVVTIGLGGIYQLAAKQFGIDENEIARCAYDDLPASKDNQAQRTAPKG